MARDKTDKTDRTPAATPATTATRAAANEWGIPDWRDASGYADCEGWDSDRWRWEFLRRRADYRSDYHACAAEIGLHWPERFDHENSRRYELTEFHDPRLVDTGIMGPSWQGLPIPYFDDEGRPVSGGDIMMLPFDLTKPLGPQLEAVRQQLEQAQVVRKAYALSQVWIAHRKDPARAEIIAQKLAPVLQPATRAPKHHTENWAVYLRVLDAREAGASLSAIVAILPPHIGRRDPKAAHNVCEQARALQFRF